ncbi:MAG: AAC(3) family N-acetyltransferase, partial [Elusimicrobia bacterium]|nr:AAC(3) family N-acetyltransferase [Elusimicrobiota bacterium]
MIKKFAKELLSQETWSQLRLFKTKIRNRYLNLLPKLTQIELQDILQKQMGLKSGDTVFVTSSVQELRLDFAPDKIIDLMVEIIGPQGTLTMPVYTKGPARGYLQRGEIFDLRRTPSMTGLLTELFRRREGVVRSLHPTKSVAALGPKAPYLTREHHCSPWPYGAQSPYYRLIELEAKIIGLGVTSAMITIVHAVEDFLKDEFPVVVNDPTLFKARCINDTGQET